MDLQRGNEGCRPGAWRRTEPLRSGPFLEQCLRSDNTRPRYRCQPSPSLLVKAKKVMYFQARGKKGTFVLCQRGDISTLP